VENVVLLRFTVTEMWRVCEWEDSSKMHCSNQRCNPTFAIKISWM